MSVFIYDPKSSKSESVPETERGALLINEESGFGFFNSILDTEKLLYCIYKDGGRADICTCNIRTKEHIKLFEDDERITFRIIGEINDKYIGHKVNFRSETQTLSLISKEDCLKGNLGASEKLF